MAKGPCGLRAIFSQPCKYCPSLFAFIGSWNEAIFVTKKTLVLQKLEKEKRQWAPTLLMSIAKHKCFMLSYR